MGYRTSRGTIDRHDGGIEVFPTGPTLSRAPSPAAPTDEPTSDDRPVDEQPSDGPHGHRSYHARPGHRPGTTPGTTSARAGGGSDIVRPLLVAPATASRIVLSGEVFVLPVPHLRIDTDHADARFLVWTATIVGDQLRPIPATLHLLGSPSMVVSVLELVPARRLRWGRERFVRYGVEAVDELAHRIEHAA